MKQFALMASSAGTLFEIQGESDAGLRVYYYLLADRLKASLLAHADLSGDADLTQYGRIIYSGFGTPGDASQARAQAMVKEGQYA